MTWFLGSILTLTVTVVGTELNEGVEMLLHSTKGAWLDSILWKDDDVTLHLRELRDTSSNLLRGEHIRCRCSNAELGLKELGGAVINGSMRDT